MICHCDQYVIPGYKGGQKSKDLRFFLPFTFCSSSSEDVGRNTA